MNNFNNMDIYTSGKLIQKLATRMEIGQMLLKAEAAGRTLTPPVTAQEVQQKYTNLVSCVEQTSAKFGIDNFGALAGTSHDDYGDNWSCNDRIIHIGYLLNGFAAAIQYENDNNMPASQRFENQNSGIGNYTYGQVGKIFLNNVLNPQNPRQFSAPDGHSWLSGMTAMGDGDNTESDSEALNGDLGAYRLANAFTNIPNAPDRDEWQNYAQYAQTLSAAEAQSSRNLWQVDGSNPGLYAPGFGNDNNFSATNIFNTKIDNDTWWGSNWATRLSIGLLPVNEQQVDSLLYGPDGKPTQWTLDAAKFIMKNFNPNDPTGGTGPGDGGFVAYAAVIVGAAEGGNSPDAQELYNWCVQHNQFDNGIDALGLAQILDYETNKKTAAYQSASKPMDPISSLTANTNGIQV